MRMLLLRIGLLVVAVTLLGLYFAGGRIPVPTAHQAQAWLHQLTAQVKLPEQVKLVNQSEVVTQANQLVSQTQSVLDSAVKPSTDSASLTTRTFEYGRYIYCKEVVKEWEKD